jgi:alkanesulfonate monooxygenase SsuD/methylene tetrahydromethanopterin reductase-like flavin-dependent oxidoreductase (luciferase family)
MKIGLYMATQWREGADLSSETANLVDQARAIKANGFASLMVGQHFVSSPLQMFQAIPLLARLAAEVDGLMIGPGLVLLPLFNPVIVAEEAATIDWLSNGNYVLALGLGYRQEEFTSLGVPFNERVPRFVESVDVIRRLWREKEVTHEGRFYTLPGVRASVQPKRAGGPPIWIGGDVEGAVKRAARIGDGWITSPMVPFDEVKRLTAVFRETRKSAGLPPAVSYPVIRECHVGPLAEVRDKLLFKYQAYAAWGQSDTGSVPADALVKNFDRFCAERFAIGDEAQVAATIARYRDEIGIDHILFRVQWPGLDQKTAMRSIERLGKVIAKLR